MKRILALLAFTVLGAGCVLPLAPTAPTNGPVPVAGPVVPARPADEDIVIGWTPLGTEIKAQRYGSGPNVVLFVGGIHGNEDSPEIVTDAAAAFPWDGSTTVWVIEELNPDGARNHERRTSQGIDLNRDGSAQHALETRVQQNFVNVYQPQVVIQIHSPSNYSGHWGGGVAPGIASTWAQRVGVRNRGVIANHPFTWFSYAKPTVLIEVPAMNAQDCSTCWDGRVQASVEHIHWMSWVLMEEVDGWL